MTEVSTPPPMLPPEVDAATRVPDETRPRRRLLGRIVTMITVVAAMVGLSLAIPARALGRIVPGHTLIDDETIAQKPGSARPTADRVKISVEGIDQPEGAILFTTVAVDSDVSIFDWLESELDDDIFLRRRSEVFGDRSDGENRERNLEMMRVSKDIAIIVALDRLGIAVVEETGQGFQAVVEGGPVDGLLEPGDIIVGIDGVEITTLASLRAELETKTPGETGVITVDNIDTGETRDVELVWGTHPDGLPGGFIGIESVVPRQVELPLPFEVEIDSGSIGGPSAGLAFTLTILDLLTEGELTGGQLVAVTGTILGDGSVGNIGGVGQKAAAAYEAGAVAFIVPQDVVAEAIPHARGMPIIGVTSLDEALAALADLGGQTDDLQLIVG
jgi:Lon-like protease